MATITLCDTCKTQSPNAEGLFVANGWTKIKLANTIGLRSTLEDEFIICEACMRRGVTFSQLNGGFKHKAILVAD